MLYFSTVDDMLVSSGDFHHMARIVWTRKLFDRHSFFSSLIFSDYLLGTDLTTSRENT